jgi:hypothetical protein
MMTNPNPIKEDRTSWRLGQGYDWPRRLKDTKFTMKVLEITGKKNGEPIASQWFRLNELQDAIKLLKTLDSGHIWQSEGAPSIWGMLTTNRKRVKLNNHDCIYFPK